MQLKLYLGYACQTKYKCMIDAIMGYARMTLNAIIVNWFCFARTRRNGFTTVYTMNTRVAETRVFVTLAYEIRRHRAARRGARARRAETIGIGDRSKEGSTLQDTGTTRDL